MTLLSYGIFIWFIVLIALAWLLPKKWQVPGVSVLTAVFMGFYVPLSFFILFGTTVVTYYLIKSGRKKTSVMLTTVSLISAILVFYKIQGNIGWFQISTEHLIPLGLSYYSFRQIHYIFENYKNKLPPHSFLDYLCYLFFLPTLFVGPIHRFPNFLRYVKRRRWDPILASKGLERILYGYVKILFIANFLVSELFVSFAKKISSGHPFLNEYLDATRYGLNLYFQFSGYSDVAIGLSLIIGFKIIENFNYPFLAINISDFWKRWHTSLSDWCRDYVYYPVASATRRPQVAIISSMLVLGLWHAVSFQYVCWGLYHGLGIACWHNFQKIKIVFPDITNKWIKGFSNILSNFITMNFVIIGFIITKEPDMKSVIDIVRKCFSFLI